MILRALLASALLAVSVARASDLALSVQSVGSNSIAVAPGDVVNWSVVGTLTDAGTQGLAAFVLDVSFDGGNLSQASAPVAAPMTAFAPPNGLSNPAGYGGKVLAGKLLQAGGAQNTLKNSFAAVPIGSVVTGVALPGAPQVLLSGSLTAPLAPGTYTLHVDKVMANGLRLGGTGTPFWTVDPVGVGTVTDLTIEVVALTANPPTLSLAALASQTLSLDAGEANAGRTYYLLGAFTGTTPGFDLASGVHVPLNPDAYFLLTFYNPNTFITSSFGVLNGSGQATATFHLLPGTPPSLIGLVLNHAYVLLNPKDFASNAVSLEITP